MFVLWFTYFVIDKLVFFIFKTLTADMLVPEYSEKEANKIIAVLSNKKKYESIDVDLPVSTDLFCPILNNAERYEKLFEEGLSETEIDKTEAEEILKIQESREVAGCTCGQLGLECSKIKKIIKNKINLSKN